MLQAGLPEDYSVILRILLSDTVTDSIGACLLVGTAPRSGPHWDNLRRPRGGCSWNFKVQHIPAACCNPTHTCAHCQMHSTRQCLTDGCSQVRQCQQAQQRPRLGQPAACAQQVCWLMAPDARAASTKRIRAVNDICVGRSNSVAHLAARFGAMIPRRAGGQHTARLSGSALCDASTHQSSNCGVCV
jgi:hypothetical protein